VANKFEAPLYLPEGGVALDILNAIPPFFLLLMYIRF